jgi:hypothetical protein
MLGHMPFYHGHLRIYTALFGKLFDDITIVRRDELGVVVQEMAVPISYGPKEKWVAKTTADPDFTYPFSHQLPRMSYEMSGVTYMGDRQTSPIIKNSRKQSNNLLFTQLKHVPYELDFSLYIRTKTDSDAFQILEQIVPFFTPEWTVKVNTVPGMDYADDTFIIFQGAQGEHVYEGDFEDRRTVSWTLSFKMQVKLYGPLLRQGPIKRVMVDLYAVPSSANTITVDVQQSTPRAERVVIMPGLTSANTPTSYEANSIPYFDINVGDNWTFIEEIFTFQDNKHYDPVSGTDRDIT